MANMHFELLRLTEFVVEVEIGWEQLFYSFGVVGSSDRKGPFELSQKQGDDDCRRKVKGSFGESNY